MEMIPVESDSLRAIGYDPETEEMRITFNHGATYRYLHVPSIRYEKLMAAPSRGRYFSHFIRPWYWGRRIG